MTSSFQDRELRDYLADVLTNIINEYPNSQTDDLLR